MVGYTAGSVTAKIELNTSDFDSKVKELQGKVDALKAQLQNNGLMDVNEQLKQVQAQLKESTDKIKTLEGKCKDYKKQLNALRDGNKDLTSDLKKTNKELKQNQTNLDNVKKSVDNTVKSHKSNAEAIKTETNAINSEIKKKKEEVTSNEQVTKSLKQQETQAKKTSAQYRKMGTELNKSFTKDLYNSIKNSDSNLLKPIYDNLKQKYKPLVKNKKQFDALWQDAIPRLGTKLLPSRDPEDLVKMYTGSGNKTYKFGMIDKNSLKSVEEIKESFREVAQEESKATVEATKLNNEVSKIGKDNGVENTVKEIEQLTNAEKKAEAQAKKTEKQLLKSYKSLPESFDGFKGLNRQDLEYIEGMYAHLLNYKKMGKNKMPIRPTYDLSNYMPVFSEFIDPLEPGNRKKYVKQTQKRMQDLMKLIGVELSPEKIGDYSRVKWGEKGALMGSWDLSNMVDLKSPRELVELLKQIGNGELEASKAAAKLDKEVSEIGDKNNIPRLVEPLEELTVEAEKASKETAKLDKEVESIGDKNNIPRLVEPLEELTNEEKKATTEAKKLNNELNKGTQGRHLTETGKQLKAIREAQRSEGYVLDAMMVKRNIKGTKAADALNPFAMPNAEVMNFYRQWGQVIDEIANKQIKTQNIQNYLKVWSEAGITVKRTASEIDKAIAKFADTGRSVSATQEFVWALRGISTTIKEVNAEFNRFESETNEIISQMTRTSEINENWNTVNNTFYRTQNRIRYVQEGLISLTGEIVKVTQVLSQFNFKLLEGIDRESIFYQRTTHLASAMWKLNSGVGTRGSATEYQGRQTVGGYSNYISQISKVQEALERLNNAPTQAFKEQLIALADALKKTGAEMNAFSNKAHSVVASMDAMGKSNELAGNLSRVGKELSHFSSLSSKNKTALAQLSQQTVIYRDKLNVLETAFKKGEITAQTYDSELTKLSEKLKLLGSSAQQAIRELSMENAELAKTGQNVRKFGSGMTQTAHSGRILSNTLYQIRGALLSVKMIFTAMGGMALWGFAADLAEGVKETFTAKNEMEAQLRQNKNVGQGGIAYFNKQLDQMTDKFKKINKYSIGETVSSIGLEFDMTSREMADSLDIVSMIQSEYVRAGRKEDEAALAVKDILQGEFQRLSRETGVGKEELIAYGWDEDKTNIEGLMDALRKAALDRHWDIFAKKATSLNDVMTITKSRFSETGADLMQSATPWIVGAFNAMIDVFDKFQESWNGMSSFWQTAIGMSAGTALFGGILTALPMVTKGMGLADIATIGWGKSILTAALNLNKAEVAQYGFKKALAATISGTSAAELSETRWSKAIFGRILGVNQGILAERGYKSAIFNKNVALRNGLDLEKTHINLGKASILNLETLTTKEMGRAQKLAYLTNNISLNEAAEMSRGKAILKTATSWRVLRTAILGVVGIGLIGWFASVAAWTDTVKKNVEAFQEVSSSGKEMLEDAKKTATNYENSLDKLKKGTDEYAKAENNLKQAQYNVKDLEYAKARVDYYKKINKQKREDIKLSHQTQLANTYKLAGKDNKEASELASGYTHKVAIGQYYINKALDEYNTRLYQASQHMNEHVAQLEKAGVSEEARVKYIDEYNMEAENAASLWKKFNEGDLQSGVFALLSELKLIWIDISSRPEVVKFMEDLGKAWEDMKPQLKEISKLLEDVFLKLVGFFDELSKNKTLMGAVPWIGLGTGILFAGKKIYNFLGGSKSTIDILKTLGGKLKDGVKKWRNWGDEAETAKDKAGMSDKSTGGINGDVDKTKAKTPFKDTLKSDAQNYARAAIGIAAGMALITEAIVLLRAPMGALAELGWQFKQWEPEIRKGIEGLQLIAPVMAVLLPPVIALSLIMDKYAPSFTQIVRGTGKAALGIAAGMLLVAEAIIMIVPSIWALGKLGDEYSKMETAVANGTRAMKAIGDSLRYLAPFVPIFIGGIALVALAFAAPEIGLPALGAVALGIAAGMLLLSEAIITLQMPLEAIREVGENYPDLTGVQNGANALKVTSEALKYVSDAMGYLTLVDLNLLAQNILDVVSSFLGTDLTGNLSKLTEPNGVLDQLSQFVTKFNSDEFTIETINQDKVTALSTAGDGIQTVGDAMSKVKTAMDNLPDEFKQGGTGNGTPVMTYDAQTDTTSVNTGDVGGYFDKFKEPLRQLKSFVYDFNNSEEFNIEQINQDRVANISSAASMIETVNTAVEKVKTTMQNIGGSGHETAFAQGGALSALGYDLFHMTGAEAINNGQSSGEYKSSLGSQLKEMENVVSDIFTFQSNISSMGGSGGENTNVDGATAMVTTIQTAISNLAQSLSDAVPTFEGKGNAISSALVNGVKKGLDGLGTGISGKVATAIDKAKPTAETYGKGLGWKVQNGFKTSLKIATTLSTEVDNALKAIDDSKKQEFYDKGNGLGSAFATGFKDGAGIHSPGYAAQAMQSEVGYIGQYITEGINNLPNLAIQLANSVSSNFNPSLSLGNFELPNISQFQQGITTITNMANNAKTQVSSKFNEMKTNIGTSFTNIKTNVGTSFGNILTNTRTSLNSMKSATIKNIGNIKTSWRGMQTALINSAENIKTQTGQKISKLKTNLGEFWNKIKHPDQLISGAAGGHTGTIKRRFTGGRANMHYAGGTISRSQSLFKSVRSKGQPSDNSMLDYLKCMMDTGKPCYAGGWNFNWTNKISKKFKGWNTHFGAYHLDDFLNVGKFENSNFPVKHRADVAKQYIFDVISSTNYDKYFDSNFGDDPVAALRAGAFNCWDGTNIVLAIARAFGFNGDRGHGTWNGIGHVWANIPGLGIIDPTAIQNNRSFTSSAVKGYSAGSMPRRYASRNTDVPNNRVVNNTTEVHIHGNVYGVDDLDKAIENGVNKAQRKLFRNSLSGV